MYVRLLHSAKDDHQDLKTAARVMKCGGSMSCTRDVQVWTLRQGDEMWLQHEQGVKWGARVNKFQDQEE